jgi:hypothetical protein
MAVYFLSRDGLGQARRVDYGVILAALRSRYGPEYSHSNGQDTFHWFFDSQGRSLAGVKYCDGNAFNGPACQGLRLTVGWQVVLAKA